MFVCCSHFLIVLLAHLSIFTTFQKRRIILPLAQVFVLLFLRLSAHWQSIEIIDLRETKKVKSLQMFHRPVASASQGDRVGICVTQLDHQVFALRAILC